MNNLYLRHFYMGILTNLRLVMAVALAAVALALPSGAAAQESFEREIESVVFVPKGQWITGLSVGYQQSAQNKYQFFLFEGITGDTYQVAIVVSSTDRCKRLMSAG